MPASLRLPWPAEETFTRHAVVAQEGHAAEVGREVLRRGGTAVDAAIATAFALAVTLPEAGNLGGGGFIVAYLADRREVVTVDFREKAPRAATPRMYLDREGKLRPRHRAGAWAAGVPGTVRGLGLAHARWGKLPWADLVRPAVSLARDGFPISADLAGSLNSQLRERKNTKAGQGDGRLGDFPESVAALARPDRAPWKAGDRLIQSDLAATLARIAAVGARRVLHRGDGPAHCPVHGAEGRPDHAGRPGELPGQDPPGRSHHLPWLRRLEHGPSLIRRRRSLPDAQHPGAVRPQGRRSPGSAHRCTASPRQCAGPIFTRATRLGDPDFTEIPVAELVSKAAALDLAGSIGDVATKSASLAPFPVLAPESEHTTHLSTIDAAGNAVALTYTLEDSYGAKAVVAGAGFLLNNEMGDFNLIPGRTDTSGRIGTPANLIEPGKRMLSSMTPTIVLEGGIVRAVTGSPGGRTIPNTTLWVVLNLLEFGLAPRGGGRSPDPSPVVPRCPFARGRLLARAHPSRAGEDGAYARVRQAPGDSQHDRRRSPSPPDSRGRRSSPLDGEGGRRLSAPCCSRSGLISSPPFPAVPFVDFPQRPSLAWHKTWLCSVRPGKVKNGHGDTITSSCEHTSIDPGPGCGLGLNGAFGRVREFCRSGGEQDGEGASFRESDRPVADQRWLLLDAPGLQRLQPGGSRGRGLRRGGIHGGDGLGDRSVPDGI